MEGENGNSKASKVEDHLEKDESFKPVRKHCKNQNLFKGVFSFHEEQNILNKCFEHDEAEELRDLGVSIVNADDVTKTILEQVKDRLSSTDKQKSIRMHQMTQGDHAKYDFQQSDGDDKKYKNFTTPITINATFSDNMQDNNSNTNYEQEDDDYILEEQNNLKFYQDDTNSEVFLSRIEKMNCKENSIICVNPDSDNKLYIWELLWNALYDHQKEGVLWFWSLHINGTGGILADEMGLGKSITVAAFFAALHITYHMISSNISGTETNHISEIKSEVSTIPKYEVKNEVKLESMTTKDLEINKQYALKTVKIIDEGVCSNLNSLSTQYRDCKLELNNYHSSTSSSCYGSSNSVPYGPVLLVSPATLLDHWLHVFHKWYFPFKIVIFNRKDEQSRKKTLDSVTSIFNYSNPKLDTVLFKEKPPTIMLSSYETMRRYLGELRNIEWSYMILDEGHKIRNPDSRITLAVKSIATCHRLLLSGSPIQNNLRELWSLTDFVCPGKLGTLPLFEQQFVIPIKQGGIMNATSSHISRAYQSTRLLQQIINPCILRRRKHQLQHIIKLPPQAEHILFCSLTPVQYDVYCSCLQLMNYSECLSKGSGIGKCFALLNILREACNHPELLKYIRSDSLKPLQRNTSDFSDEDEDENEYSSELYFKKIQISNVNPSHSGKYKTLLSILKLWREKKKNRVLIFTQGVRILNLLVKMLQRDLNLILDKDILTLDGSTPVVSRFSLVERFNNDSSIFLFILTSRVGGVGLNIMGANRIILYDPWWNPMTDAQAKERCWRIGQDKEVIVYRLITKDTVEEKIYQRQLFKQFIANQILQDAKYKRSFQWSDISELLKVPEAPKGYKEFSNSIEYRTSKSKIIDGYMRQIKFIWGRCSISKRDGIISSSYSNVTRKRKSNFDNNIDLESENNLFGEVTADAKCEHQAIMHILGDQVEVSQVNTNYEEIDNPINQETSKIVQNAMEILQKSSIECGSYSFDVPTWTGKSGKAGAPSSSILKGLKQQDSTPEILSDERLIRKKLTEYFLQRQRLGMKTTTENVLDAFGSIISENVQYKFKNILRSICHCQKSRNPLKEPSIWILKR
ncbi:SNF2 family N-terminal domain-containing protein [Cryptosporidium muris RN66]|uniref:SNF2 family N-terminal domain-containing protein n=1 Tax=Cryptosporidium muris (strain RN66) TaxID=441375 RepID=B6A925_CRYMR|nr:SNF2 family N-terminal domain-containing protein [Cryptosporidium muris RN66]EEA04716.1 SNF2 family N-terminal domain-containing protein [Cryptosporidium muris RN66]|eukprot:XP_002139065.1 SNF2 family N-terminal domain-containing protein [Cryptosporidium muris RN66]